MSLEKRLRKVCGQDDRPRVRQSAVSPRGCYCGGEFGDKEEEQADGEERP